MDYAEQIAKLVLEATLPGTMLSYRVEQSHGGCDFEFCHPNGTTATLEVTSSVNQTLVETVAAIRGERAGGPTLKATKCSKSWIIFPAPGANIPEIRRKADSLLSHLEQQGIERFSFTDRQLLGHPTCKELDITSGSVFDASAPPIIMIAFPVSGGAVGPTTATKAAEDEAQKLDNRKKLGVANTGERHLAVYVDVMNGLVWNALTSFAPPSTLPTLPEEITHICIIGHSGNQVAPDEFVIWHADAGTPWQRRVITLPPRTPTTS
ncbi:MAG TPA: hypothetical protein VME86_16080 [Acidobacteriaceae bacterium]|nr:hypothetical protein [Acidobacteriaceae bacterium]